MRVTVYLQVRHSLRKRLFPSIKVSVIGRTAEFEEHYFTISLEGRLKHPAIVEIVNGAITKG